MRLLALIAATACVAATGTSTRAAPKSPVVLLVHGRGHVADDSAVLRRRWKSELDSGLARVGAPLLDDTNVRLAWYADVLDAESDTVCDVRDEADSLGLRDFARGLLGTLSAALRHESSEARSVISDVLFVIDSGKRCAAVRRVGDAVERAVAEQRPVVIVAYSLGAVVAYDYLLHRTRNATVPVRLITVGSPLGNREIRELLGVTVDSVRIPATVESWENIYDPDDPFAARIRAGERGAAISDRAVVDTVRADGDGHYIGHYLRDRATGAALARALGVGMKMPLHAGSN